MRYLLSIVGLLLVIAVLGTTKYSQISQLMSFGERMKAAGPPPETVATRVVEKQTWNDSIQGIASVVASQGVTLSNDAPGVVVRIHFDSGDSVKAGATLVELNSSVERAQLGSLRAKLKLAETALSRSRRLVETGAIASAQLDADDANYQALLADERALAAQIERKVVKAPFAGRLGIRMVNLGQYLAPGTALTVLESAKAVYADFTLSQIHLSKLEVGMPVRAFDETDTALVVTGRVTAIDPRVDTATRNVKVRATLEDPERKLQPGMFLRVQVEQPHSHEVAAVPASAIVHAPYGDSVFRVEARVPQANSGPGKVAKQQFVKLGDTRGDYVAVLDGLSFGQEIVTAGAFKLRNGIPVVVNNTVQLDNQLNPRPINN